jgi:hypothetical protein
MPSSDETTPKAQPTPPFSAGTIKRIHVNQHVIRRNAKTNDGLMARQISASDFARTRIEAKVWRSLCGVSPSGSGMSPVGAPHR